jgi:AcrR family transcriptional regulator
MPRQVDHDARRHHIAEIAAKLIARRGPDGASLRSLATEAGWSTTAVTHYFADKRELLQHAYRAALLHAQARLVAIPDDHPDPLRASCEAVLPLDRPRRQDWQTWLAFFGAAVGDPSLAAMQRRRVKAFRDHLASIISAEQRAGRFPSGLDVALTARELLAVVHGIGSEAAFDSRDWPPARQLEILDRALARVRAPEPARS